MVDLNLGVLRSDVTLHLHTLPAARIWTGVRNPDQTTRIIGMSNAIGIISLIKFASANDDPYADKWLLDIDARIKTAQEDMKTLITQVEGILEKLPDALNISDNLNIQPATLTLHIGSPLGFRCIYLLTDFDILARRLLLAHHVGMMGSTDKNYYVDQGAHILRSLVVFIQRYKNAGITRSDMKNMNARARDAIGKFGELPQDILEGTKRSEFAPAIIKRTVENEATDLTDAPEPDNDGGDVSDATADDTELDDSVTTTD